MQHTIRLNAIQTARAYGSAWEATGPQGTNTTSAGMYGSTRHYAFLRFGAVSIPSYANIVSATLQFYVSDGNSNSGYTHTVSGVSDDGTLWTGAARNGAVPDTTATAGVYISNRNGRWYTANILALAQAWQAGAMDGERGVCISCGSSGSYKIIDGHLRANCPVLTIVYDVPASVPVPAASTVALGGSLTTNILTNEEGVSHEITYKAGGVTLATYDIGASTSHTYTVPASAGESFPSALTGVLTIEVTTTVNDEERGAVSAEVTLTLPDDAAPTCTCTPARTWIEAVTESAKIDAYVQDMSGVQFTLSGMANYGAAVASCRVMIEGKTYTIAGANGSAVHLPIAGSGTVSYTYAVTDTRGLTQSYTGSLPVLAWDLPQIAAFAIARVTAAGDEATDGTYAQATVQASVSPLLLGTYEGTTPVFEAQNKLSYRVQYRQIAASGETESEWTDTDEIVAPGMAVNTSWVLSDNGVPIATFDDMTGYEFRLTVSDIFAAATARDDMPTKAIRLSIHHASGSLGFGGDAAKGAPGRPEYDFYGPIRARFGIEGVTNHAAAEVATGGRWVDGRPIYRLSGMYAGTLTNGAQNNFPLGIAPIHTVIRADVFTRGAPSDGSSGYWWFPATYNNATSGNVNYSISYLINNCHSEPSLRVIVSSGMDVRGRQLAYCIEYTKTTDAPTYYHLPYLVLAVGQDGCVVSSSSEFSSGYYNVYAFGGSVSGRYWACAEADAERWIQVQMPYKLKNMIIKLTSPIGGGAQEQYMPVAGTFQGSNDGSAWTQLGAFADRPATVGGVTEHALENAVAYKYLRVQVTQPGAGTWTGFGDIRVQGEVEAEAEAETDG